MWENSFLQKWQNRLQISTVMYGDLDVAAELRASSLPRWKVISMTGGFSRSGGLQAGIDYVTVSGGVGRGQVVRLHPFLRTPTQL